jgi:hypothetical protein
MHSILQNHVRQHIKTVQPDVAPALRPVQTIQPVSCSDLSKDIQALLLVDTNRTLATANRAATDLLNLSPGAAPVRGQLIDSLANGMLASVPLRPTALRASSEFLAADGRILLATSRLLKSERQHFKGWLVTLQETSANEQAGIMPHTSIDSMQTQINALNELITMLPQFSQHQYWRYLLVEHMQKITKELEAELRHLDLRLC